jgi:hypothetical protein
LGVVFLPLKKRDKGQEGGRNAPRMQMAKQRMKIMKKMVKKKEEQRRCRKQSNLIFF